MKKEKSKQERALEEIMRKMAKEEKKYTVKNGMIVETDNKKEKQEYLKG